MLPIWQKGCAKDFPSWVVVMMTDRGELVDAIVEVLVKHIANRIGTDGVICECGWQSADMDAHEPHVAASVIAALVEGDYQDRDGCWHTFSPERWRGDDD